MLLGNVSARWENNDLTVNDEITGEEIATWSIYHEELLWLSG